MKALEDGKASHFHRKKMNNKKKMVILQKAIHRFNTIVIKIPMPFLTKL